MIVGGLGVRVRLEGFDPVWDRVRERLPADWGPLPEESPPTSEELLVSLDHDRRRGTWRLALAGRRIGAGRRLEPLLERLEHRLPEAVTRLASGGVGLHAGLVCYRGQGLLLPGRSFSGKSTLVAALVAAGARFESDDLTWVQADGRVRGIPRPLSLRSSAPPGPRRADELGWQPGCDPLRVARVALLRYRPGAALSWEPLSPATGALSLFRHALDARRRPRYTLLALAAMCERGVVLRGVRGEAMPAARALLDGLGGS